MKKNIFDHGGVASALFALSLLFASAAWAGEIGKVLFKSGTATIRHADNTVAEVVKDEPLNAGDTIETQDGRVQFSLIDGGKVSLQPNSIYKINKYAFSGKEDGSEYAFTELVKGGLRTISGLIGHKNPERYQLKTAVATIGIRGTEFTVNYNNSNLLMTTNQGSVEVCNGGGCLVADAGMSIAVSGAKGKPVFSSSQAVSRAQQPSTGGNLQLASNKPVFAAADIVSETGLPDVIENDDDNVSKKLANYNGKGMVSSLMKTSCACGIDEVFEANLVTDSGSQPTNISTSHPYTINLSNSLTYKNDQLSDGIISIGRIWDSNASVDIGSFTTGGAAPNPIQWMDYIVGEKPAPGQLNNLTGTYAVFASTAPMFVDGAGMSSIIGNANDMTGSLAFNFGTGLYSYNLNLKTVGDEFQLVGSGSSLNKNSPLFYAAGTVTSTGSTCSVSGCNQALHVGGDLIQGAFFGKKGDRAGLQYGFTASGGTIYGSAALK